jgi:hypothetical protein
MIWLANYEPCRTQTESGKALALNRPVKEAKIIEIIKVPKGIAFTYCFNVSIIYSAGDPAKIIKKYEEFVELHRQLLGHFPEAAGPPATKDNQLQLDQRTNNRILPELPAQALLITDAFAQSRAGDLQNYIDVRLFKVVVDY